MNMKNKMENRELRRKSKDVKKLVVIIAVVTCVGAAAIFIGVNNSPYNKLMKAVSDNNAIKVISIYDKSMKGNEKAEDKVKKELESQAEKILEDFENEKFVYDEAIKKISFIADTGIISDKAGSIKDTIQNQYSQELERSTDKALKDFKSGMIDYNAAKAIITENAGKNVINEKCESVLKDLEVYNTSRQNFTEGMKLAEVKDYTGAVAKLKTVIKEDENYDTARKQIKELQTQYKNEVLETAESLAKEKKYDKAALIVKEGLEVLKKDKGLTAAKKEYEEKNIAKLRGAQKLKISYPGIVVQHPKKKDLYPDMLSATVTNEAAKVLTYYEVGFVAFDRDGNPLEIRHYPSGKKGSYVVTGMMEDVEVKKGESYGKGYGWEIYEKKGISTVKACVVRAEFKDGTAWENPFYPYWKEMYAGKQYIDN